MIRQWSVKITDNMINNGIIQETDVLMYQYSVQLLIEKYIGLSLLVIIAFMLGRTIEFAFFWIFFANVRKYSGGYHCKTFVRCIMTSILTCYLSIYVCGSFVNNSVVMFILWLVSVAVIMIVGTVNNADMNWSKNEYRIIKKRARVNVLIESLAISFFLILGVDHYYIKYMVLGITVGALSIVLAKFK